MSPEDFVSSGNVSLQLPALPGALAQGRRAVEHDFADCLEPEDLEDVKLLVTELLANSVRHAYLAPDDNIKLLVQRFDDHVRIEVQDSGPCFEGLSETSDTGGRGLLIVDSLSRRWGSQKRQGCKVWCEVDVS